MAVNGRVRFEVLWTWQSGEAATLKMGKQEAVEGPPSISITYSVKAAKVRPKMEGL